MTSYDRVEGNVIEIVYQNPENGYTVAEIDSMEEGLFTATGYMPFLSDGERIALTGMWVSHPEYGEQFKAEYYESILPTDEDAILRYLSSGIVPGIREATAIKLIENFGDEVLNIMLNFPERLSEVKGISKRRALKIGEDFQNLQSVQGIVMFLQQYRVSANMAVKVHQALGTEAVEKIKKNPYILSDKVDGISFKTADNIAYMMDIPKNNPERIRSGVKYFLSQAAYNSGHTYLPYEKLLEHAIYNLEISRDEVENALSSLVFDRDIVFDEIGGVKVCYLKSLADYENYVALRISSLVDNPRIVDEAEVERNINIISENDGITLAPEQFQAVKLSASAGCMVVTGGPGTGKTTTIKTIIKLLTDQKLSIALTAPTGRAAKRMSQVCGMEAMTIHRLLGVERIEGEKRHIFTHNEENPLKEDVIIVDEMSMIDIPLMQAMLKAVKAGGRIIFSGDADQLPSVGPGNVLGDIIASGVVPKVRLGRIFRQAQESLIVLNAHRINFGELPDLSRRDGDFFFLSRSSAELTIHTISDLYKNRLPKSYGLNPISDIQILSPSKKGIGGISSINNLIQRSVNPPDIMKQEIGYGKSVFRVGDKVMQTKNNYDIEWLKTDGETGFGIFNGDMGIIASISASDKCMNIVFDDEKLVKYDFNNLDELELAYAITVHKSQGSEFPVVIIPMCSFPPMLMCRNLFYTAVTRAKQMVVLVGNKESVVKMVSEEREARRYTGLSEKLLKLKETLEKFEQFEF